MPENSAEPHDIAAMTGTFRLDPAANATFQVFDFLRDLIVSVRLRPGQRISDKAITAALGVGRTPVREALIRLDEVNLVRIVPQSGTYVTKISVSRYTTACFIRLQLELGAVRSAALRPDPRCRIEDLTALLDRQSQALSANDHSGFFELDEQFHRQIFVLGGCLDVWTTARRTQFDLNRARRIRRHHRILRGADVLREHADIVAALRARDAPAAEDAIRTHIGDLDRQMGMLFTDERLHGLIELPAAN